MPPNNAHGKICYIQIPTTDVQRSAAFYEQVFEARVIHEDEDAATLELENTILNLLDAGAAGELVEPATVGGREAGSRFLLTIWVDDADAESARLRSLGVALLNGPVDRPWGVRTASFADPDGHVWELAQRLDEGA